MAEYQADQAISPQSISIFPVNLRLSCIFTALTALSGCSLMSPTYVDESSIDPDGLYAGEPLALHATELPVTSSEEARARARTALTERDIDLALYFYVQAVNLEPGDTESLYAIAAIHDDRGNTDLAIRAYQEVCTLDPTHSLAHQGLGLAHFEKQNFDAAEESLETAIALDDSLWRAHNALGILADRNEEYAAAISHYSAAIAAQPSIASIRNNRGYSRYLSGDLDAAKLDFRAALAIDPAYGRAWQNLGLVFAREQDYDAALETMLRAIEKHVALNDIGYIAMLDGNYQIAQQFLENAIIESPRHYQTAQDNLDELRNRRAANLQASQTEQSAID